MKSPGSGSKVTNPQVTVSNGQSAAPVPVPSATDGSSPFSAISPDPAASTGEGSTGSTQPGSSTQDGHNGKPANGTPANGTPANGTPANGTPADGIPANGNTPATGRPLPTQTDSHGHLIIDTGSPGLSGNAQKAIISVSVICKLYLCLV